MTIHESTDYILERAKNREKFFRLLIQMFCVAKERGLRLIFENPWSQQTFLKQGFVVPPSIVDNNRMLRGDFFVKPTAYWFVNCEPTYGFTMQKDKKQKSVIMARQSKVAGVCSEERSMISPDYARNFIHDFVLGKYQSGSQMTLF